MRDPDKPQQIIEAAVRVFARKGYYNSRVSDIAREAGIAGPRASAALIAADDVAVTRFLDGSLDFLGIPRLLEAAVARFGAGPGEPAVDDLIALDAEVRAAFATGPVGGAA